MSKVIDMKKKKSKIEKKKYFKYVIFGIIIIYVICAVYLIIKTPTDTVTIDKGILTFEESTTGYIIRNEEMVKGKKYKNGISQIVFEGERAAKKQTIFRYYGDNEEKLEKEIEEINLKIQDALDKQDKTLPSDVKNLDKQIENKIKNIEQLTDIQKITEVKKEINDIIIKKSKIAGELSPKGSYIKKLITEREKYEKQLATGSETIKAPVSGVVSYKVDGLENILTTDNLEGLTKEKLEDLDLKTGKLISTSNESAKIIDNFGCYIATVLNSQAAKDAKQGDSVKITLASGEEVVATINNINKQNDDEVLIVFKINTLTEEFISYRKISFNITWWSKSGLKVPNDSIAEDDDGYKYVMKKTNNGTEKILIKLLKRNDKYSIISTYNTEDLKALGIDVNTYKSINQYDTIMMYPKTK
ncbi:MAG: hypothetical protein HFJ17_06235 [Clostridia bacterium]|nr:hypothetical protein [Clostridia bacterium]